MNDLTIIVPVYNESKRWNVEFWNELISGTTARFIFVNDGSTDNSLELIFDLQTSERVLCENLTTNVGKAEAIAKGLRVASTHNSIYFGYLDADSAFKPSDIIRILELSIEKFENEGFDSIWSSRILLSGRTIERKLWRQWLSRLIATILGFAYPGLPYDTQSGFKLWKSEKILTTHFDYQFNTKWYLDLELFVKASREHKNFLIWEEPVLYWKDVGGSKIAGKQLLIIIKETLIIFVMLSRLRKTIKVKK
jgi:glycosyltransferase involved in cell wall biosynthesis